VRDDTSQPWRVSSLARFVDDLDVPRKSDIGLPRVAGPTISSSASTRLGCFSMSGVSPRPPPAGGASARCPLGPRARP